MVVSPLFRIFASHLFFSSPSGLETSFRWRTNTTFTMTEQQMRTISVEELVNSRKISRKTYNILVRARMRTVFDLVRYKSGLPRLFRTGAASVKEINALLEEVEGTGRITEFSSFLFPPEPEESKGEQLIDALTEEKMEYLEEVYKQQVEHLAAAKA